MVSASVVRQRNVQEICKRRSIGSGTRARNSGADKTKKSDGESLLLNDAEYVPSELCL